MTAVSSMKDRVVIMSGGSRGIGLAIARALAAEGAKIALIAKTGKPHPRLEGLSGYAVFDDTDLPLDIPPGASRLVRQRPGRGAHADSPIVGEAD